MTRSLQDLLQEVGNPIRYLRNCQAGAFAFPVVPAEFTSWRNEQRAWRETVAMADQSYHMTNMLLRGSDALGLLNGLGVNSFRNFVPGKAKQFVVCGHDGHLIGDVILFYLAENELLLVGRAPAMNWVQFHAETGGHDVQVTRRDRSPLNSNGAVIERDYYRFQIQGPNARLLFERLHGGPLPEIKFFNFGPLNIGPYKTNALRHSMAGVPGFEIWGPFAEGAAVHAEIVNAGREFGLRLMGSRSYGTTTGETDWLPAPVPAIYTSSEMRPYREWLPATGYEAFNAVGGSFASDDIEDYYITPFAFGYGNMIRFDHDFIGREALERMAGEPQRKKVTFVWNPDDVVSLIASNLIPGETAPFKMPDFPVLNYSAAPYDRIVSAGKDVGFAMWTSYSYNERSVLSVGIVDADVEIGDQLELIWGEECGGTEKTTVEPHRQMSIRVRVARAPYAQLGQSNRTEKWLANDGLAKARPSAPGRPKPQHSNP